MTHDEAIQALCDCAATVTVLSYQEAIEGYFKLRGLPIPLDAQPIGIGSVRNGAEGDWEASQDPSPALAVPGALVGGEGGSVGIAALRQPSPSLASEVCEPSERELLAAADHFFDQDNWETTCPDFETLCDEMDLTSNYGGGIYRIGRLKELPDVWAINLPETWDEDGNAEDWEVVVFPSKASAEAARRRAFAPEDAVATAPARDGESGKGDSLPVTEPDRRSTTPPADREAGEVGE